MRKYKFVSLITALLVIAGAAACAPSGGQEIAAEVNAGDRKSVV